MGRLDGLTAMTWSEIQQHSAAVRLEGLQQFIRIYNAFKESDGYPFLFGDEMEYMMVRLDAEKEKAALSLRAKELLMITDAREAASDQQQVLWRPESASYQMEGTPARPYKWNDDAATMVSVFDDVLNNMRLRRVDLNNLLPGDEVVLSITSFPRLGCPDFTHPVYEVNPGKSMTGSLFQPDETIGPTIRYQVLTGCLRQRRCDKISINVPIMRDKMTADPFIDPHGTDETPAGNIYMDTLNFGMGLCCLQVTMQCANMQSAINLYDQLANMCPLMMSLTASCPAIRGYLLETDCRWSIIEQSTDERTPCERGDLLSSRRCREDESCDHLIIDKSRCGNIPCYLHSSHLKYNDREIVFHQHHFDMLRDAGISEGIAQHVAHLFIRDPLILFHEGLNQDDQEDVSHFANIQATNWHSLRFKPPEANNGWRVEFRTMEAQVCDFENAAFVVFMILLSRVIQVLSLDLVIPISLVQENMKAAEAADAANKGKFWFKKTIAQPVDCCQQNGSHKKNSEDEVMHASLNEIFNGSERFHGLIPVIRQHCAALGIDTEAGGIIHDSLDLVSGRASGGYPTNAQSIRRFIKTHPEYKQDSVVSDKINYDLMMKLARASTEKLRNLTM